jgi:hypothetical protein
MEMELTMLNNGTPAGQDGAEMKGMKTNREKTGANREGMKAKIEAISYKFEVLRENVWTNQGEIKTRTDALVSRIDAH